MQRIIKINKTEKKIRHIYLLAFILLFISYLVTLFSNRQLVNQSKAVEHTNTIIKMLNDLGGKIKDAETGFRGYLFYRDIEFLFPYYGSRNDADSLFNNLLPLTKDNSLQEQRLLRFKKLMDHRFQLIATGINVFNDNGRQMNDSLMMIGNDAKKTMDDIRRSIQLMEDEEERLLLLRESKMAETFSAISTVTIVSLTVAFSLLFFGFITYMQISRDRKNVLQELSDNQEQLKTRIEELDQANTELIKMRSQEKFAATGRIARAIAHEVRNPLTNINLATDQLKSEINEPEADNGFLFEMISRNSARINDLISDLLNSTKFADLNYEKKSINDILDETLKEAEDRITLYQVKIVKKYATDLCSVSVDKIKMKIALLNIIINAIEAMENKDEKILTLETKKENNKCKVRIPDTGAGMDTEAVSRIFEAYFTNKPNGNGLGLTNTQNIILNHNGEISVESIKEVGTTFSISLHFAG